MREARIVLLWNIFVTHSVYMLSDPVTMIEGEHCEGPKPKAGVPE